MFGKKDAQGADGGGGNLSIAEKDQLEQKELQDAMKRIRHKIVVLSGKGGVGKSTVAVSLAQMLLKKGFRVGLLDVDIHGPSVPKLLGIEKSQFLADEEGKLLPIINGEGMKVMSVGFLLQNTEDPVIWRGPLKYGLIKQFLKDVLWDELDYLVIDSPPGTGDEPLSVCQLIENPEGAVIVTTPQEVAIIDVKKSISFCRKLNLPVIGVVENMSGFICPHCGERVDIFKSGGGKKMAEEMGVPFLGVIPLDASLAEKADSGQSMVTDTAKDQSPVQTALWSILDKILENKGVKS